MKIYGRSSQNHEDLLTMEEVTLQVSPDELKAIISFFNSEYEKMCGCHEYGHSHLIDFDKQFKNGTGDIIIAR